MALSRKFTNIVLNVLSAMKMNSSDYCDIETVDGSNIIVMKNRTMMTLIRYDGMLSMVTVEKFNEMINRTSAELNELMKKNGHKIACVFRKDLDAQSSLENIERIQKATAHRLRLDMDDLIEENMDTYRDSVYDEETYFALITMPAVLDKVELEVMEDQMRLFDGPVMAESQNLLAPIEVLRSKHISFVEKFMSAISADDFFTSAQVVDILQGLSYVRHQVLPDRSSKKWIPAVALEVEQGIARSLGVEGYRTPVRWATNDNPDDISYMLPPPLSRQILSTDINVLGAKEGCPPNTIAIGGRLFVSAVMDIPPTQPAVFNKLFSAFNQSSSTDARGIVRSMPFSVAYLISSDGMAGGMLKQVLKDILAKVPPSSNDNMRAAYNQLAYYKREGEAIVGLQISAMTWVEDTPDGRKKLRSRKTRLMHTLESWGGMTVVENLGDPILGWRSNILGLGTDHYGTKGALRLNEALELLPFTRPASPFQTGTILNKTLDGKLMKLEKFSSSMNTWTSVIVGRPGSGKSVMLNNLLTETCLMPGLERLPFITVIDKGFSSTGFIDLIHDALPANMRHLTAKKLLRTSKEYAINPFDIKVGLTYPLQSERLQMISFLTALLTPAELTEPYPGTQLFVGYLITKVFDMVQEFSENSDPKMYARGYNAELDRIIMRYNVINFNTKQSYDAEGDLIETTDYQSFQEISYFALVRKMHLMGIDEVAGSDERIDLWRGRDLAHRRAMPVLQDVVAVLNTQETTNQFTNTVGGSSETIVSYASRTIGEIISAYECFSYATEFDVDSARIVSLDLQEVLSKSNRQQSSLFLQVARMVAVKKISLSEEDIRYIPPLFQDYYREQLRNLLTDRKVLAIDEMHNATGDKALMKLLETDAREGRKWGLELIFASQNLSDFDFGDDENGVHLLRHVTQLCVCATPKGNDLKTFTEYFTSNPAVISQMQRIGLSSHGLTYLSYISAKKNNYCALMTLAVGNKRIWSLTTTADDRLIRNYAYEIGGNRRQAIAALAYFYPGGAAEKINQIRQSAEQNNKDMDEVIGQTNNLVRNMAANAIANYEAHLARLRYETLQETE